jgi:hypothetical protein
MAAKDVMDLKPGEHIVVGPGRVERVAAPSERGSYNTVTIHTDEHDITTTLPCSATVADSD